MSDSITKHEENKEHQRGFIIDQYSELEEKIYPPLHYQNNKGFDVIDFCKAYNLNFNRGNVAKYISRAGKKEDELKDLKKALDYLQREIKYLEGK